LGLLSSLLSLQGSLLGGLLGGLDVGGLLFLVLEKLLHGLLEFLELTDFHSLFLCYQM